MPEKKNPGKKNFDAQVAALDALREQPDNAAIAPLRTALQHQNNYIVSKAADQVAQRRVETLLPDLLTAFDRFFEDAARRDPQCWAKNSISRALAALELQDPAPFLRGLKHIQLEGTWGGSSDTAGALRGTCALALVQCRTVPETDLLRHLIDVLVDSDKSARNDAIRALEQLGSPDAALLLRLRAQAGGDEPEILGACYAAVLSIEGNSALPWVNRFLSGEDDTAGEAALSIAATHSPEAFQLLKSRWEHARDPWFKSVLLSAMALTRQNAATEFLLALVRKDSLGADLAVEALLRSAPSDDVAQQLKAAVAGNARLERAFAANASQRR
jgi:HEAT repeat protein